MDILMYMTYAAIVFVAFRVFKIPVNKWTVTTAFLGGVVLCGGVLLTMNYNHPSTGQARFYFFTTPIMPQVRGLVVEVPVQPNQPLKAGDILFKIDPRPFQYAVDQKKAELAAAKQNVLQLQAALDAAKAEVKESEYRRDRAKEAFDRFAEAGAGAVSQLQIDNRHQDYLLAEDAVAQARATARQAKLAYESQIDGVNTSVARIDAELRSAEFDLEQTVIRAPTDGYVIQQFLRPGMMAVPLPLRPVMVFVTGNQKIFAGAFPQNALQRIQPGENAEIAFNALPGRIVNGKVAYIVDGLAQGQLQPSGNLEDPEARIAPGRALVVIDIEEDLSAYNLPAGSAARMAVYSNHWVAFAIIRQVFLRMKSWQNYLFLG
jgi:multidrug resistance efflux pump